MSFDLSWLWSWLNNVADTINQWIQGIGSALGQITDIPKAIWSGLVAFGSAIWDGLQKFGTWIYNAYQWIEQGFYNLGKWIADSLLNFGATIYNIQKGLWDSIVGFIEGIWNSIINIFENFRTTINNWFVALLIRTRQKIKDQIVFSLTTYLTWKYGEKVINNANWKKLIGLPIVFLGSFFGSYLLAEMIDKLIPNITQGSFDLIPPVQLPQISLQRFPPLQQQLSTSIVAVLPKAVLLPQIARQPYSTVKARLPIASVKTTTVSQPLSTTVRAKLPYTKVSTVLATAGGQQLATTVVAKLPRTTLTIGKLSTTVVAKLPIVTIRGGQAQIIKIVARLPSASVLTQGGQPSQVSSINITLLLPGIGTGNKPLTSTDITVTLPLTSNTSALQ